MKNLLCFSLFILSSYIGYDQIPAAGNVLWLRADYGIFKDNVSTPASPGNLVQVWEDQSGSGNHFRQDIQGQRPQLFEIANVLCSQHLVKFDVGRRTYLESTMKMSGPKTIFIVFIAASIVGNPQTLLSIKGFSNTYTEILCTDNAAYKPLSYIAEVPASPTGGILTSASGNNVSFSPTGNIFTMTYNGLGISSPSSYKARYDTFPSAVAASGFFGRLPGDTTTIGARAPEQNYSFLSGYIAEIIVYSRVLPASEIGQVESYLSGKYGFYNSCIILPMSIHDFTAEIKNNSLVQLDWSGTATGNVKEYVVEHSTDSENWDSIAVKKISTTNGIESYQFIHYSPDNGLNYYRLGERSTSGKIKYSEVKKLDLFKIRSAVYTVFPNPIKNYMNVDSRTRELLHITITDLGGKTLKELNTLSNSPIEMNSLPRGMYFIKVSGKAGVITMKIFKE